jgi:hypothetical protein
MLTTSKGLRRERVRPKRVKFWQALGRMAWKLVILARVLARLVELVLAVTKLLRE